jgi:uncharacterized membrane protein
VAQTFSRIAVLLAALLVLGLSPLGFIPISGPGHAITLLHVPMILGATLEGPFAAAVLGGAFGLIAGFKFPVPGVALGFHVMARVLAGLAAALTFQVLRASSRRDSSLTIASAGAVVAGTLTNTMIMTLLVLLLTGASPEELLSVAILHGVMELMMAMVVVVPLTIALVGGGGRS